MSHQTQFLQLNQDWNAEPNAPEPQVSVAVRGLVLEFTANASVYPAFDEDQRVRLIFDGAWRYRLGPTNDEGWNRGQCRFSGVAPKWGEFYELQGDLKLNEAPDDWVYVTQTQPAKTRHFLFYLRDHTFECNAGNWRFEP